MGLTWLFVALANDDHAKWLQRLNSIGIVLAHKSHEVAIHAKHHQFVQRRVIEQRPSVSHDEIDCGNLKKPPREAIELPGEPQPAPPPPPPPPASLSASAKNALSCFATSSVCYIDM